MLSDPRRSVAAGLRARLAAAPPDAIRQLIEDELVRFCAGAVREEGATVDELAVELGVGRALAAALCAAEPKAAVAAVLAGGGTDRMAAPETPDRPDWLIGWVDLRTG